MQRLNKKKIKKIDKNNLPKDIEKCHAIIEELLEEMDVQEERHCRMVYHLEKLLRWRYGPKRERVDPNQMSLFAVGVVDAEDKKDTGRKKEKPDNKDGKTPHGRQRLPKDLKRERVNHDLQPEEKRCPECHEELRNIGEEKSERLEYVPAHWYVIEDVRQKYACPKGCTVVTASKPMQPIEKGLAGAGLLAHVAVSKYADHLPLYRQQELYRREGIDISRKTMCGWMQQSAEVLQPLFDYMKKCVLASKVMQTDDTPVGVLDPELPRTRIGRIWTYVGDAEHPYTVYDFTPTRSRDGPEDFMEDFSGYLQADAYSGYDGLYKDPQRDITEVACWAHARRKFYEAQSSDMMRSMVMMAYIRLLYDVEREARDCAMDSNARMALRQEKSVPILNDIEIYLKREHVNVLPKSPIGEAVGYALNNWQALLRYSENGDLEIDNNGAERSLRGITIGRKNWLFFGSDNGGRTAAVLTSFIITCKRHHVNPFEYLRDIFDRISAHPARRIDELLPDKWKAAHIAASI